MAASQAELGQTQDPRALVPGDPDAVVGTMTALQRYGDALVAVGDGLCSIDDGGWQGAAADGFRANFDSEPARWGKCGDAFQDAAGALGTYIGVLRWAQGRAAEAIQLYNEGEAATEAAKAEHKAAVQQAVHEAMSMAGFSNMPLGSIAIPFHDPGEEKRAAARDMLKRAREQVLTAGDAAERIVGQARDLAPEKPKWWESVGEFLGDVGEGLADSGRDVVNGVASVGNAMLQNPADVALTVGGGALTVVSAAGTGGGAVVSATGVGAIAGAPLSAVSLAGVATGAGMAGVGLANIARHATTDDRVALMKPNGSSGPVTRGNPTTSDAPRKITGHTKHGEQQAAGRDGGRGVSDTAMRDAVENPIGPPEVQPGGTFRFIGKDAVVVLNSKGEVITTWARNAGGWR